MPAFADSAGSPFSPSSRAARDATATDAAADTTSPTSRPVVDRRALTSLYSRTRARTEELAGPLSAEDQVLQSMPDASPTKWHRAHTTWFFETFVLGHEGVAPVDADYAYLFNSYYEALGPRHPRPARGLLSRPSAAEIADYRAIVDGRVLDILQQAPLADLERLAPLMVLGIAHEEQHQELLLTDIVHAFSLHPGGSRYRPRPPVMTEPPPVPHAYVSFAGGLTTLGCDPDGSAFCFDNEGPAHRHYLEPFALGSRLVTWAEYAEFHAAGGYRTPSLWLADGYDRVQREGWTEPLYARLEPGSVRVFGVDGWREAELHEPAVNLSAYEADAFARFAGARLPREAEWEHACRWALESSPVTASLAADRERRLRPGAAPAHAAGQLTQLFGEAWQWTSSAYAGYPGYRPAAGALGEYNGKFMASQLVLRGGSAFTPSHHLRTTYRNFWPPHVRWQLTGLRLAKDSLP